MFCTGHNKLNQLLGRNEGKLKAYESCLDVRAWSHDIEVRNHYIRDWIKSDMPICVIPARTVSTCLRIMTRRHRGRSTPRCHPNCKSKVVLESICDSCHAMKECLKGDENFEKYFEEEEFETSHWPCERCLDALKSLKMFWKIITEKIFKISIPENEDLQHCSKDSVQSVAKVWQKELIKQALVVKQLKPIISERLNEKSTYSWKSYTNYLKKIITLNNSRYIVEDDDECTVDGETSNETHLCYEDKATETIPLSVIGNRRSKLLVKKISKCTSFRVRTVDFGGDTCKIDSEEVNMYKNNLDYLQQQYNMQSDELSHFKTENISLKLQLQNMTKRTVPLYSKMVVAKDSSASVIPKPYESYCEDAKETLDSELIKNIDSEMIITLKNCDNENFKHISMLQVLHKTNGSRVINENLVDNNGSCNKNKQDPIKILTKVHNTFGAIVKRELTIANQRKCDPKEVEIDASYQKVHASKSVPSCSTVSSLSDVFASTTEV